MVKLFSDLPNLFRERYLKKHDRYLKSFADIAATLYFKRGDLGYGCEIMIDKLLNAGVFSDRKLDEEQESKYFRSLRNAWYHELVLNYPQDDLDQRSKFAPWKIIQCYYCVLAGISALIRCFDDQEFDNHIKIFNMFTNDFLNNKTRRNFFLPPYNFYLDQQGSLKTSNEEVIEWEYGKVHHIPYVKKALEEAHIKNRRISFPHYLIKLRNWVQYEDAYLFFLLYGKSVKGNLDFSLSRISYGYMVHVEFFLIKLFGWKNLEVQFNTFIEKVLENLGIEPVELIQRYEVYEAYLQEE